MLKLLYIPTGNIFVLPDEEALAQKNSNPHNYRILDAGFQEEQEPVKSDEGDIKDVVLQQEERAKEIEEEDKAEVEAKKEFEVEGKEYKTELDFDKFTKADLVGALRRVGIKCNASDYRKPQLIEMAIKAGIKP